MANKKRRLGRGLDALLGPQKPATANPPDDETVADAAETAGSPSPQHLREIPVEFIQAGKYQPRKGFDQERLEELADSIRNQGVMQPIVLRQLDKERFEIIAGERRWRATQLAGLDKIPALIRDVDDESMIAMSLIENIQREDLNPMEEAIALARLLDEFELTHQQVADAVGKSRTAVTNLLRLINLAPPVARMLVAGDIEMGHARALLALDDPTQVQAAQEICDRQLNVRQAEALVRKLTQPVPPATDKTGNDADTRRLENLLGERLGQPVTIKDSGKGKGRLTIAYNSLDELDNILSHFGELE